MPNFLRPQRWYAAYIFDLDGTVYLGNELLPHAAHALHTLRQRGCRTFFLSNNPTHTRQEYANRLTRLGVPTPVEDVVNSSMVMVDYLQRHHPTARLFVIGEAPLQNELRAAGFTLTDQASDTDAVIVSFDRTFDYHKLQVGFDALRAGAHFLATNADRYCPVPGGGQPDAGALIAALETATSRRCEVMVGKPSAHMIATITALTGLPPHDCLMTGDRLETDVQMGLTAGMSAALTLTGATTPAMLAEASIQPTYVVHHLGELLPAA